MDELKYTNNSSFTLFGIAALIAVTLNDPQGMDIIDAFIIYLTK